MALMRARTAEVLPGSYAALGVRPLDGLMQRFGEILRAASGKADPTLAILSTGPDDQYYLDHKVFAAELDAVLAERHEVEIDRDGRLVHRASGRRLDVVYERIEDGRIYDDLPGLIESQASGQGPGHLRAQPRHSRRQGRLPLCPRDDPDLPGRRADPPERRDLLPGRRGRQTVRHGPLRRAGPKEPQRLGRQGRPHSPGRVRTRTSKSSASRSRRTPSSTSPRPFSTSRPTSCARPRTARSSCATRTRTIAYTPSRPTPRPSRSCPAR